MLVVHIGHDADDAARGSADVDELHDWVCPHDVTIDGVLTREHALGHALADDDDWLAVAAIGIVEVASSKNGNAECREKSGRDGAQLSARIFFTGRADVAVGRKLEARTKAACVSPGNNDAKGDAIHAGQCVDASH